VTAALTSALSMTPDELEQRAAALLGPRWQTELARRSGVEPRAVRYWKNGDRKVPPWVPVLLHAWETLRSSGLDWG
jgi:transcriptional regulator with XRE-family HTH domain